MIKSRQFQLEDLEYYRFSVYRMGTNVQTVYTFLLGDTLIDTAHSNSREEVLARFDQRGIQRIALTHYHEDHSGNAGYLKRRWNIPVYGHPETARLLKRGLKVSPLSSVISGHVSRVEVSPVVESEVIPAGKYELHPVYTPGHSIDHYSYYIPEKGWLFSGDLFVAERIKYFANFESIKEQILSLRKLCALDFDVLLCSHNPKVKNGKAHLQKKLQNFEDFYGTVKELTAKGLSPKEILEHTGRKENKLYDIITLGNFNAINMVKSVLKDEGILQ
jgi:glyoxylase-like metal-dependent hydrolase (beta-lactamase superfamily II)